MVSIRNESLQYEAGKTKNIADLEKVSVDLELENRSGTDKEGKAFAYKVVVIEGQEYRVPLKVIGDLRAILENSPNMTHFRVIKKGQGMSTTYTVVPIFGGVSPSSSSYPKVIDVILPNGSDDQKKAYDSLLKQKAVLHDKMLLGMLSEVQFQEMVKLLESEYLGKYN